MKYCRRGRLKKERRPRYADNSSFKNNISKDSTGYENSYVIVNGKRIDNVEEAINVTKYSRYLQITLVKNWHSLQW
jgi:hypothetical protein